MNLSYALSETPSIYIIQDSPESLFLDYYWMMELVENELVENNVEDVVRTCIDFLRI